MVGYADEALVSHQVSIRMPLAHDPEIVSGVLGESPIPVTEEYPVQSPWITIDGRIHRPASDYLRQHCARRPNLATARRIAGDLAAWLDCLCNHWGIYRSMTRGILSSPPPRTTSRAATEPGSTSPGSLR